MREIKFPVYKLHALSFPDYGFGSIYYRTLTASYNKEGSVPWAGHFALKDIKVAQAPFVGIVRLFLG